VRPTLQVLGAELKLFPDGHQKVVLLFRAHGDRSPIASGPKEKDKGEVRFIAQTLTGLLHSMFSLDRNDFFQHLLHVRISFPQFWKLFSFVRAELKLRTYLE
jgi:hypothetical protein